MTLTRLAEPTFSWLPYPQIMESMDWYGAEHFGPCYGNFWSKPCRIFPHRWSGPLRVTDAPSGYARFVRRCSRCGSQIHTGVTVEPPKRGIL